MAKTLLSYEKYMKGKKIWGIVYKVLNYHNVLIQMNEVDGGKIKFLLIFTQRFINISLLYESLERRSVECLPTCAI